MPEPMKPNIPRPEEVKPLKSGESHMAQGCLLLFAGIAAMGGFLYVFRDFFLNNVLYCIIILFLGSGIIRGIMFKIKGK